MSDRVVLTNLSHFSILQSRNHSISLNMNKDFNGFQVSLILISQESASHR